MTYKANDRYRATLRSTWVAAPADSTLEVTSVPTNLPTIVVVGWNTALETKFSVTNFSGTDPGTYSLTGVTRIEGANENLPINTPVNCLNNEEFFNQYATEISALSAASVPAGGTTGQVLTKSTDTDNDTEWVTLTEPSIPPALPTGVISAYGGATAPTGYLLCDGSAVSRTTYADLFTAISTAYGVGDGTTTFNVPDLKGRVAVGKSTDTEFDTLGETGGAKTHTLGLTEIPAHGHTVRVSGADDNNHTGNFDGVADSDAGEHGPARNTSSAGGGLAHNNLQPYITVNYIIKT